MKKIKAIWINEQGAILWKENVLREDLPRIGENVISSKNYMLVTGITHNYDDKTTSIFVEVQ